MCKATKATKCKATKTSEFKIKRETITKPVDYKWFQKKKIVLVF